MITQVCELINKNDYDFQITFFFLNIKTFLIICTYSYLSKKGLVKNIILNTFMRTIEFILGLSLMLLINSILIIPALISDSSS